MRLRNIIGMPVMQSKCHTCPFGEKGVREIRASVEARIYTTASQLCHGAGNKRLCRGARDEQLKFFHRLGFLQAPTDREWKRASEEG